MEGRYDEVYNYLMRNEFPFEFNKIKRQNLVRYAAKFTLVDDVLLYKGKRAIKYKEECKMVFKEIHSSPTGGHYGRFKSRNEVCARYYWPGITMDIEKWCCECECQEVGKTPVVDSKPDCVHVSSVWEYVGMDLTGPLPMTISGHVFILTITDYFSKWVEALPLKTKSAMEVARNLCSVIYRHGCPVRNLSDQDREFINEVNSSLCELLGITWCAIVADYPEKNNENTRRALTKLVNEHKNDWDMFLEPTLFSLRLEVNGTTRSSPFKLMYGREARLPSEVPEQLPLSHVTLPGHENIGKFAEDRATDIERERKQEAEENSGKDNAQDKSRKILKGRGNTGNSRKRSASAVRTSEERVLDIWTRKNIHQVEAVVGPYKLFNSSFKTLHGSNWLSDEGCVFPLSAVVSFALFSGNFQCVTRVGAELCRTLILQEQDWTPLI